MQDCIFCQIIAGAAEASIVFRDDLCTAFLTIQPVTEGHTLVVPNVHVSRLADVPAATAGRMMEIAQRLSAIFDSADIRCEGTNLVLCDGEAAGQTVFHAHLHVNPRYKADGFGWKLPESYHQKPSREELNKISGRLSKALSDVI